MALENIQSSLNSISNTLLRVEPEVRAVVSSINYVGSCASAAASMLSELKIGVAEYLKYLFVKDKKAEVLAIVKESAAE